MGDGMKWARNNSMQPWSHNRLLVVLFLVVACERPTRGPSMAETESWFHSEFPR